MSKKLIYQNSKGERIEFSYESPFYLVNFEGGTSMPPVNVYTSKGSGQQGENYVGSTMSMRNILIDFTIDEDYQNNRSLLYKVLIPNEQGVLIFEQDEMKRQIECRIELLEIDDNTVPKTGTLSLLCPSPYWEDLEQIRNDIAAWIAAFEFPFEPLESGTEMGYRQLSLVVNVFNAGNVALGMKVKFKALGSVLNPSLYDIYKKELLKLDFEMQAGDEITISTLFGKKKIELSRDGLVINIINKLNIESEWLQLQTGDNLIRYDADENIDNLEVSIYYTQSYLGV